MAKEGGSLVHVGVNGREGQAAAAAAGFGSSSSVDRFDESDRTSFSAMGDEFGLGDEKLDQAITKRKRRKNKPRMMILMLMGDWFLDLIVLEAFGFSSEGERERVGEG